MKRTELHESYYASSLIEASLDPLIAISMDGKITDLNQAKVKITGIERESLLGTNFYDYFTDPEKALELYKEVFAKGSITDSPLTFRHKNGNLTDVLFNGSVYKDEKGTCAWVQLLWQEILPSKNGQQIYGMPTKNLLFKTKKKKNGQQS